ncbi:MAG: NAD(P)/FAD-dependent oxidoreductase [Planctomycetaceae bacterium]|nr:NAD(P)/FAD-dependent oxidoreductase [Planctomycetaceae bacterium]
MHSYHYLIVGGGMTGDAAVRGIRQVDPSGPIAMISAELHPPYDRPPLTKGLWKGKPLEQIWRNTAADEATLWLGHTIEALDPERKLVRDESGTLYRYEKLLLATGGTPRRLPCDSGSVLYYRTLNDYHTLRKLVAEKDRFVVVGAGFIGSEIAAALALNGKHVVMVFPEAAIGGRMFPADLAHFLNDYYRERGVEIRDEEEVLGVFDRGGQAVLQTRSDRDGRGREITADAVIAGVGIQPNVALALQAGLELGDGIRVDPTLRTSEPDIFAAGDVAEFFNPALGQYFRVEHEDNANTMGELAGRSMAGQPVRYDHLPFFYSDLFDLSYEAVGELDSRLQMVSDWKEPFREGVVYYLRGGRVCGTLLWNVWERIDAARQLIAETGPFEPADLHGPVLEAYAQV